MYTLFLVEDDRGIADGIPLVCRAFYTLIYRLTARAYYGIVAK